MGNILDLNSPLMRGLTALANVILLSFAWIVFSIPIVTIGPATAALYYATQKMVLGENISVFRCFWKGFRDNLKQGTVLGLIFGAAAVLMYYDYLFSYMVDDSLGSVLRVVFGLMAVVWLMLVCYTFPLQAQFQNSIKYTLKNALLLSLIHLRKTVLLAALHLVPVAVCLVLPELFAKLLPLWMFAAPGGIAYLCTLCMKKVWLSLLEKARSDDGSAEEPHPSDDPEL